MAQLHGVRKLENSGDQPRGVVFGQALDKALTVRGLKQVDVAAALDTTQSTVSAWKRGQCLPDMDTVFGIERLLELRPGHLSRHLGYLPLEAETARPTVEDAIAQSTEVDEAGAKATLIVWRTMVEMRRNMLQLAGKPAPTAHTTKTAPRAPAPKATASVTTIKAKGKRAATSSPAPTRQSRRPSSGQ